ncbi:mannose-1-phosphate guanylyltransferase/mannose-6-phosphate isomerase [Methylophilaceae bacterium]|nr:mannose-1-phosphate guanylyltransferase/mannose-6-phosphate isomerase [Methylophilaceae bacterium]|tara:strand:- start:954 stop:2414 length:1461 start_codon:yes stop_codon:yes gene_type:complete
MKKAINVSPVILCGGTGSRLWPLSRSAYPKQFITLIGSESLFQQAVIRLRQLKTIDFNTNDTLVLTNEEHRFVVLEQLKKLNDTSAKVFLEPVGKNTAPALTIAAMLAQQDDKDPVLVVTPSDQIVRETDGFVKALSNCIKAANEESIVIMGITPDKTETGYGYIKHGLKAGQFNDFDVEQFIEKPSLEKAEQYVKSKDYLWNGGIFVVKASIWLNTIRSLSPDIFEATLNAFEKNIKDNQFIRPDKENFSKIPSESIDYAVIEKCNAAGIPLKVVPLNAGWSDLGSWDSLWSFEDKNEKGNVTHGDVVTEDTKDSFIHSTHRLVGAVGVKDIIIVETADAVLVANRNNSQGVKDIVNKLNSKKRTEGVYNSKVHRPWGWYMTIDEGKNFKVKRIQVNPGASLSLQKHSKRAEHWVVVKGTAKVENGDKEVVLTENESTFIPLGELHRLSNPMKIPLEIIEVQSGEYLGEDDIERIEDNYGRNTND